MRTKRCCFSGHGDFSEYYIKHIVTQHIKQLITEKNVKSFWVGNYGNFDSFIFETLLEIKAEYKDIAIEIILPYLTNTVVQNINSLSEKSDNILLANIAETTPNKYKLLKTNQYMVDNSDFLICYVNRPFGGASSTLSYALKSNRIQIINLAISDGSISKR